MINYLPFGLLFVFVVLGIKCAMALRCLLYEFLRVASLEDERRFVWDYIDFKVIHVWTVFSRDFREFCDRWDDLQYTRRRVVTSILLLTCTMLIGMLC